MSNLDLIISDYRHRFDFAKGETFMWSPTDKTIYYPALTKSPDSLFSLLHELGHALLNHRGYRIDIELIKLERQAWDRAEKIAKKYNVKIPADHIEDALDTYRDWLLKRARCPDCELAGLQDIKSLEYSCINCASKWQVPELATCLVRRRKAKLK